ncbi:heme A synthase [Comamonas serinivorans]|uniref:Heme A synthase n=1 Tax=Comamonas serinivorans TaxID=1082851 RepID=A0A1Y0ETE7_9BURK|nr:COX15/CtaA family protein [Comamonas serinivorans]ARU06680.1 heme A synthase [Comamonas serinivorans]
MSVPLYDLSPVLHMLAGGAVLAALPMAWLLWRTRGATGHRRLQALTLMTLFLTFDLVLFGAFTRLTDSGLGCPDWPGCYGNATPLGARHEIAAEQAVLPDGPVTHQKAWIEMIHRYLATGVGGLILVLTVWSWRVYLRQQRESDASMGYSSFISPWWATVTLLWVLVQGAFGAWTVTMKLFPAMVTTHLLLGIGLLAVLCAQAVRYRVGHGPGQVAPEGVGRLHGWLWLSLVTLVVQLALGGWVSTNYAVLACNGFPQCQGSWWPPMDLREGFEIWRHLGQTGEGQAITFDALVGIHFVHRLFAIVVTALLGWTLWRLHRGGHLQVQVRWAAALLLLQLLTGLSNVVLDWPLLAAVMHTGGAAALTTVLTWALCASDATAQVASQDRALQAHGTQEVRA